MSDNQEADMYSRELEKAQEEIEELKSLIKEATPWIDDYNCNHISDFIGDEKAELFQRSVSRWLEKAEKIK